MVTRASGFMLLQHLLCLFAGLLNTYQLAEFETWTVSSLVVWPLRCRCTHGSDRPQPGFTKFSGMQIDMYLFWLFRLDMYVDIWGASMVAELALPGAELSRELLPW